MLEGNAEEGFVDGDFFSEDEAGGENDGVVSQLAVEGATSPSAYARLSAPKQKKRALKNDSRWLHSKMQS